MLGKTVRVIVDRPIGSHHPKHEDLVYEVNYGYVPGVVGGDGEEQDAYILGVDEPIDEFYGVVIAVIHRRNDNEEKWVVAREGACFTEEEIMMKVGFQEKYFDITVSSLYTWRANNETDSERSCRIKRYGGRR